MGFHESLDLLRNPGDEPIPDSIYDDISGYYSAAISNSDALTAQLKEKDKRITELEAEISEMKFELASEEIHSDSTEDEVPDSDTITIDDLFEKEKDNA